MNNRGVQCPLTFSLGEFPGYLGLALISWATTRVGVHRLFPFPFNNLVSFSFTLLHLPLDYISISSLRLTYLHPFGRCFTY